MSGGNQSDIKIVLRNPLDKTSTLTVKILPEDSQLSRDWTVALSQLVEKGNHLEKNFCFLGFPNSARTLDYLCQQLNHHIDTINQFNITCRWTDAGLDPYWIEEYFTPDAVRFPDSPDVFGRKRLSVKHGILNRLHNHFENLQGTVWKLSEYYRVSNIDTRYAIRQLNNLCHEIESIVLSQRKLALAPEWVRPSQITTFLHAPRFELTDQHRQGFLQNNYDRVLGGVYMHWTQIGKTLFEVFRDESAPTLTIGKDATDITVGSGATCEAITALRFYSGEFDIEWGQDVVNGGLQPWHTQEQQKFRAWLQTQGLDPNDLQLSLGYLKIGQVDLEASFGTCTPTEIWQQLGQHLDIYSIEVDGHIKVYDYCWSDLDHELQQKITLGRLEHVLD